jgi:hypothetical protein
MKWYIEKYKRPSKVPKRNKSNLVEQPIGKRENGKP